VWPARKTDPAADLFATHLYSDPANLSVDPAHLAFSPQYPLWTDGAAKRRWISLPPGTAIDARGEDGWEFPVGTRFWKEFSFEGRRVETRYMEHLGDGHWIFAAYEWSADGSSATLAPERGRVDAWPLGKGRSHTIPSRNDCSVCHGSGPNPVLGFTALQLSPDRDPGTPHAEPLPPGAVDLAALVERGLIIGLQDVAPRIAAVTAVERAALGYLHGNCGHCHTDRGALADLGLDLAYGPGDATAPARSTTFDVPLHRPPAGLPDGVALRVAPGNPAASALLHRVGSRDRLLQMPPLGSALVDEQAIALLRAWIEAQHAPQDTNRAQTTAPPTKGEEG
jgi:mono/diheme cytochrome c family protein